MDMINEIRILRSQAEQIITCCIRLEKKLSPDDNKKRKKGLTVEQETKLRANIRKSIIK